jgi:hypothetical protein
MEKHILRILIVFCVLFGCSGKDPVPGPTEASVYLDKILSLMESNSIKRKTIDWPTFKSNVLQKASQAKTIADTFQAIEFALQELNDNHSFYRKADGKSYLYFDAPCAEMVSPPDVTQQPNIGYVRVPSFDGLTNSAQANQFSMLLQTTIKNQDSGNLKGWLVDLRGNGGGNMWPMLSGIGPVLGNGNAGYFIDPDGGSTPWQYRDGITYLGSSKQSIVAAPYTLINANPKVAVLIGLTASSGEAIAIAFVGRPNTRLFGAHQSCGQTTANATFTLSDGAILGISTSVMADRNMNKFGGPIIPDETGSGGLDGAVAASIDWLNK